VDTVTCILKNLRRGGFRTARVDDGNPVVDGSGNPVADTTRFGDYLHVRLAHPDTRYFGAFGYAVKQDPALVAPERGKFEYSYIEFGRQKLEPSPVK
jgi:hypothetical protein